MFCFLQNHNPGGGIIVNNEVGGFKFIIVYDKFYFFVWIIGEYIPFNQRF